MVYCTNMRKIISNTCIFLLYTKYINNKINNKNTKHFYFVVFCIYYESNAIGVQRSDYQSCRYGGLPVKEAYETCLHCGFSCWLDGCVGDFFINRNCGYISLYVILFVYYVYGWIINP